MLPFEIVDDVLVRPRVEQRRLRDLPSRVYFVLALGMFPGLGYARVWQKLTAGLSGVAGAEVVDETSEVGGSALGVACRRSEQRHLAT